MSLLEAFERYLPLIETELHEVVQPPDHGLSIYYSMMQYHLGWMNERFEAISARSGKRIRPLVCLLCCEAAGEQAEKALPAAAAVELIHNFSLIHDDIQDGSHYRRGRRAVWDVWGAAHAINVGDGMFVLARLALHRMAQHGHPAERQQAATLVLDRACLALCEGQYFDMTFEERLDVDLEQYLKMIRRKTATLLATACRLGAISAGAEEQITNHYYQFGENLGLAFQIQDDILGAWGDERVTGKSAATDIRDKKKTLPVVYVLNHPDERHSAWQLVELYSQEGPLDEAGIKTTLTVLERAGARVYAEKMAEDYYRRALKSLEATGGDSEARAALHELAASLLRRKT